MTSSIYQAIGANHSELTGSSDSPRSPVYGNTDIAASDPPAVPLPAVPSPAQLQTEGHQAEHSRKRKRSQQSVEPTITRRRSSRRAAAEAKEKINLCANMFKSDAIIQRSAGLSNDEKTTLVVDERTQLSQEPNDAEPHSDMRNPVQPPSQATDLCVKTSDRELEKEILPNGHQTAGPCTHLTPDNLTADNQSTENQSADNQSSDNKSADNRFNTNQSTDNQSADNQSADNQSSDNQPADNQSAAHQSSDNQPAENQSAVDQSSDSQPAGSLTPDNLSAADQSTDNQSANDHSADDQSPHYSTIAAENSCGEPIQVNQRYIPISTKLDTIHGLPEDQKYLKAPEESYNSSKLQSSPRRGSLSSTRNSCHQTHSTPCRQTALLERSLSSGRQLQRSPVVTPIQVRRRSSRLIETPETSSLCAPDESKDDSLQDVKVTNENHKTRSSLAERDGTELVKQLSPSSGLQVSKSAVQVVKKRSSGRKDRLPTRKTCEEVSLSQTIDSSSSSSIGLNDNIIATEVLNAHQLKHNSASHTNTQGKGGSEGLPKCEEPIEPKANKMAGSAKLTARNESVTARCYENNRPEAAVTEKICEPEAGVSEVRDVSSSLRSSDPDVSHPLVSQKRLPSSRGSSYCTAADDIQSPLCSLSVSETTSDKPQSQPVVHELHYAEHMTSDPAESDDTATKPNLNVTYTIHRPVGYVPPTQESPVLDDVSERVEVDVIVQTDDREIRSSLYDSAYEKDTDISSIASHQDCPETVPESQLSNPQAPVSIPGKQGIHEVVGNSQQCDNVAVAAYVPDSQDTLLVLGRGNQSASTPKSTDDLENSDALNGHSSANRAEESSDPGAHHNILESSDADGASSSSNHMDNKDKRFTNMTQDKHRLQDKKTDKKRISRRNRLRVEAQDNISQSHEECRVASQELQVGEEESDGNLDYVPESQPADDHLPRSLTSSTSHDPDLGQLTDDRSAKTETNKRRSRVSFRVGGSPERSDICLKTPKTRSQMLVALFDTPIQKQSSKSILKKRKSPPPVSAEYHQSPPATCQKPVSVCVSAVRQPPPASSMVKKTTIPVMTVSIDIHLLVTSLVSIVYIASNLLVPSGILCQNLQLKMVAICFRSFPVIHQLDVVRLSSNKA